ncbi:CBS domain-containing protein [bacterium]|nr:CBS domain-containing protein [bacterium]
MVTKLVKDYMTIKNNLISFKPDSDIHQVIKILIKHSISGAPVINNKGDLVGIISEKDCLGVLLEMTMHELPGGQVEKYMSTEVISIDQNRSIIEAVEMFQNNNFRRFPVVDGKQLVGLLSRRDVLRAIEEFGRV